MHPWSSVCMDAAVVGAEDDMSCTLFTALLDFLESCGHLCASSGAGTHTQAWYLNKYKQYLPLSPSKRLPNTGHASLKQKTAVKRRYPFGAEDGMYKAHAMAGKSHGADQFGDQRLLSNKSDAEECLHGCLSIYRIEGSGSSTQDATNALTFMSYHTEHEHYYEHLLSLLEAFSILPVWYRLDQSLLSRVVCNYLNREGAKLRLTERKSHRLAIFMDIYRVLKRVRTSRASCSLQQAACELTMYCMETVTKQPVIWHTFAICFVRAVNEALFSRCSKYYEAINDLLSNVVNK